MKREANEKEVLGLERSTEVLPVSRRLFFGNFKIMYKLGSLRFLYQIRWKGSPVRPGQQTLPDG